MPKTKQSLSSAQKAESTKSARKQEKGGERHSLPTKPKTRSPCRRGDNSTTNTKGCLHHPGLLGCRLLVLGCHRILQKKRKLNNTEQQRNSQRLSARVPPHPPNRAKAHQGKAKPSKKHLKPAPKPKWGGKSETEARKT